MESITDEAMCQVVGAGDRCKRKGVAGGRGRDRCKRGGIREVQGIRNGQNRNDKWRVGEVLLVVLRETEGKGHA